MASLEGLHPFVKKKAEQLLENANKKLKDHKMIITQGYRSKEYQDQLFAQGRTKPGNIVTNARGGRSMHNYGLAIDFALVSNSTGKAVWNEKLADWKTVVEEAKKLGFEWGGDWVSFKDYPHFQMTAGLTDRQVYNGMKPEFKEEVEDKNVYWDGSPMKKGQIGRLTILKPINLWKRDKDDKITMARVLEPGETYRVYGFDSKHGGQYAVGGDHWVTNMAGYVKYETPSAVKLKALKEL